VLQKASGMEATLLCSSIAFKKLNEDSSEIYCGGQAGDVALSKRAFV
jgi:hypothetical protein